jgi:hypothetical protein
MSSTTLDFGDVVSEAVERAGLDPRALTHSHMESINRSLQLLWIELEQDGAVGEYRIEYKTYALAAGDGGVILDSDTIDVTKATLIIQGKPVPLGRSTREDFLNLSFPTNLGQPSIFFLMKSDPDGEDSLPEGVSTPTATANTPILVVWPQNGILQDLSIRVTRLRQHRMPSNLGASLDTRRSWLPTIVAGLSMHVARKWNPDLRPQMEQDYQAALRGNQGDEDHHPVTIGFRAYGYGRSRRH